MLTLQLQEGFVTYRENDDSRRLVAQEAKGQQGCLRST